MAAVINIHWLSPTLPTMNASRSRGIQADPMGPEQIRADQIGSEGDPSRSDGYKLF
jgi:hypothetical protein